VASKNISARNIGGLTVLSNDPLTVQVQIPPSAKIRNSDAPDQFALDAMRDPHVITLSSTTNIGLAIFERAGYLWVVQDDPNVTIPPSISGNNKENFGKFEEFEMVGGKAYRLLKPTGVNLYGEGGGLLWRLVMTPNPRDNSPIHFETREATLDNGKVKRDLFVPLRAAHKKLTLKDPMVGDEITVVTVEDSAQLIGDARELVNLSVLPSYVGLAFTSFADDLKVDVQNDGVMISDANNMGLALSPKSDTDSLVLKDDIEKEDLAFQQAQNPDDVRRIYNFNRWRMGGLNALEENRRVLKIGLAAKEGSAQVEGLITMAKLNVANGRGPEALGLLRVAEDSLPGIEDTPEFIAIRGAADTLSGHYLDALQHFSNDKLKDFGEIDYWKTAALAGLEDWQQAGETIPTRLDVIEQYPPNIKTFVGLKLAETALRAGNVNFADNLLSMLEPDYKQMDLGERSAWKYLNGEMKRQAGDFDEALESWTPLLTGKDDYHRAKAGLSVTRMQLERQKITPAKAIDRLPDRARG